MIIQILVSGLVLGCVYGLIALGYSLIYKASGMLNFTQGDILTLEWGFPYSLYSYSNYCFYYYAGVWNGFGEGHHQ